MSQTSWYMCALHSATLANLRKNSMVQCIPPLDSNRGIYCDVYALLHCPCFSSSQFAPPCSISLSARDGCPSDSAAKKIGARVVTFCVKTRTDGKISTGDLIGRSKQCVGSIAHFYSKCNFVHFIFFFLQIIGLIFPSVCRWWNLR